MYSVCHKIKIEIFKWFMLSLVAMVMAAILEIIAEMVGILFS